MSERVIKNLFEFTAGPPGSPSSDEVLRRVRMVVKRAAGYPPLDKSDIPMDVLSRRIHSIYIKSYGIGVRTKWMGEDILPKLSPGEQDVRDGMLGFDEVGGWVPAPFNLNDLELYLGMPLSVVPHSWFRYVRREGGRGKSAGPRTYFEALHLLSYIASAYVDLRQVRGEMLHLDRDVLCKTYGMSQSTYGEAMRYLGDNGFISRVTIRGFVPWRAFKKGAYSFAVPRVAKLRALVR